MGDRAAGIYDICYTPCAAGGRSTFHRWRRVRLWGRCHGGRRPSSDDSFHSPTVIPPSALDKPSIMKRYHHRRTCSHTSPLRSPTMVTLHDTRFVESRWWNDGWTGKTRHLTVVGLHDTGPWSLIRPSCGSGRVRYRCCYPVAVAYLLCFILGFPRLFHGKR